MIAALPAGAIATLIGAALAATVALVGVWVTGVRAERARRRELHGEALATTLAYREFPYAIRRRRYEEAYRSEERVRLSEALRLVQADLSKYQSLLRLEGRTSVYRAYVELVEQTRATAGAHMKDAWGQDPVQTDKDMNMGQPHDYAVLRKYEDAFLDAARRDLAWYRF